MTKGDEVASFLIQERGYLVVGFHERSIIPQVGACLIVFAEMPLSQPVVIIAATDRGDWLEQARCAKPRFGKDPDIPRTKSQNGGWYFRCHTD